MHLVTPRPPLIRTTVYGSIEEASHDWAAAERDGVHYPFQSQAWAAHWYACLGQQAGIRPRLVRVSDPQGRLLLFLPLGVDRRRGIDVLVWLGGGMADYNAPILGPALDAHCREVPFREVWRQVLEQIPAVDAVHFLRQPERIGESPNPFVQLGGRRAESSAHAARLAGGWEALYERACGARTRKKDRWGERKLAERGPLRFAPDLSGDAARPVLAALFAMKSRRYHQTGSRDWLADPAMRAFYAGLVGTPAIRLAALWAGERVVAAHWGAVHDGRFYYLLPAFDDEACAGVSPGAILNRRLIQWACESGLGHFDFTEGDEPYKARWCDEALGLWDHVEPRSRAGHLYAARCGAARWATALARRNPGLHRWYRTAKQAARRALQRA